MIETSIMKELKESMKSNIKFKFQKFGTQPRYEAPGDLRVKIDENYDHIKQAKIFALVIETDT